MMHSMKIQIVDSDDNFICVKEHSDVDYSTEIYRVSALWLTNSKGQVLLAKRAAVKDKDPGKWGPAVAGTLEDGETYGTNIYKEAEEEIGLTGVRFFEHKKVFMRYPRKYFCQWYKASVDRGVEEFVLQADEVEELAWVKVVDLKQNLKDNPTMYTSNFQHVIDDLEI